LLRNGKNSYFCVVPTRLPRRTLHAGLWLVSISLLSCMSPAVRYSSQSAEQQPTTKTAYSSTTAQTTPEGTTKGTPSHATAPRQHGDAQLSLLRQTIQSYLGTPYAYGGNSRRGMDCSGFTKKIYEKVYRLKTPRSSRLIYKASRPVDLCKEGDFVFLRLNKTGRINHVGIYLEKDQMAHASSSRGVVISNLKKEYYASRFAGCRRAPQHFR